MYVYNGLHVYLVKVASNLFTFYPSFLLYYLEDKTYWMILQLHKYLDIYSNLYVYKLYSILYYHMIIIKSKRLFAMLIVELSTKVFQVKA